MERVSVIIPTHNRKELLKRTLDALFKQNYPKDRYEIVVVGDSSDDTKSLIENMSQKSPCRLVYHEVAISEQTRKRNFGINVANGGMLAFTDDDCIPHEDWLEKIVQAFEKNQGILGVEGKTVTDEKRNLFSHAVENKNGGGYQTCNIAFRKDILEKVGGFDENYFFFREDTDLAFRVLDQGDIVFEKEAVVYHPPRKRDYFSVLRELFLIKYDVRLYKKFPEKYKARFGVVGGGGTKIGIFAWVSFSLLLSSILMQNLILFSAAIFSIIIFKYFSEVKRRSFNIKEVIVFIIISYIRDLLQPFMLIYYYFFDRSLKGLNFVTMVGG